MWWYFLFWCVLDARKWINVVFPYLPKCPVSFGWMFGPVDRLRVLLPAEISTEMSRRRWSLVSSFPGHKGYALRKAMATIRALSSFSFYVFVRLFLSDSEQRSLSVGARVVSLGIYLVEVEGSSFYFFVNRESPCAGTVQCWETDACCW